MSHLDLDFKEKRCNALIFLVLLFAIIVFSASVYFNIKTRRQFVSLKNETHAIFEGIFIPKGFLKKRDTAFALIIVNGQYYLIKDKHAVITVNHVPVQVAVNDSMLVLKTEHFKRSIKW